jgi:hypothetical protein
MESAAVAACDWRFATPPSFGSRRCLQKVVDLIARRLCVL